MLKLRNLFFLIISIPLVILMLWQITLPEDVIKAAIENFISGSGRFNIASSIEGLRKGLFLTIYAESLELKIDKTSAFTLTDITSRINPLYLLKRQFVFSVQGNIGTGKVEGILKLSEKGNFNIDKVEINSIPYLKNAGLTGKGIISGSINFNKDTVNVLFEIPDADIRSTTSRIPLPLSLFKKIRGSLAVKGNTVKITSITLEGDKGYSRVKGDINNGFMKLVFEFMPYMNELTSIESKLISKYQVSPGYYVIPVEGQI